MRTTLTTTAAALLLATGAWAQQPPAGPGPGEGPTPPGVQPPLVGPDAATSAKTFLGNEAEPDQEQPPNYSEPFESPDTKENVIIPEPPIYSEEPDARVNQWMGGAVHPRIDLEIANWIGKPVHLVDQEDFGRLDDVVLDPETGNVIGLVVDTSGLLGLGGETVTMPWVGVTVGEDDQSLHAPWTTADVETGRFNLQPGSPAATVEPLPAPPEPGAAGADDEVTREAFQESAARTGVFEAWDANDDARIDAAEQAAGIFRQMDRDRDRQLSPQELGTGWQRWFGPAYDVDLAEWDLTGDALLGQEEWTEGFTGAGLSAGWDADASGALTEDEFYAGLYDVVDLDASGTLSLYERNAVGAVDRQGEVLDDDQGIWWDEDQWASWY